MKVITNDKLIKRNGNIGKYLTIGALVILFAGMAITWLHPELFWLSWIGLLLGIVLWQIGLFFSNRWGRSPRPDEIITRSLKGLNYDYTLYHYNTPVSHLLVGPAGIWVILPYYQRGTITYEKNRWKQRGGGLGLAYMKIFAQEGLGRPDLDSQEDVDKMTKFLSKADISDIPEINPVLVFIDKRAQLNLEGAPIPAFMASDVKDYIKKRAKETPYPKEWIDSIKAVLPQEEKPGKKMDEEE